MKRKYLVLLITIISILIFSGCSLTNKSVSSEKQNIKTPNNLRNQFLIGKGSLNTVESKQWETENSKKTGVFRKDFGSYTGFLIGLGRKPTGGYSVDIKISQKADKIVIAYKEIKPSKGSFTTQVITYNYNVVYIKKGKYDVEVKKLY